MSKLFFGEIAGRICSERTAAPVTSIAALRTVPNNACVDGQTVLNMADGSEWRFNAASTLTDDGILVVAPPSGNGRWLLCPGQALLKLPFTFATVDAAALLTFQAGQLFRIDDTYWRVATSFTGGSSAAIGVSSNKTGLTTKGDLLGGSAGDVLATLVSTGGGSIVVPGTAGGKWDTIAHQRVAIMKSTDTIRFDRITDAFTAGVGTVLLAGQLLANDGA